LRLQAQAGSSFFEGNRMHELGIADSIVRTVLDEIRKRKLGRVTAVGVRIGELTDVVPEALEFGFEAIARGTLLAGTKLKIEQVPLKGVCQGCHKDIAIERFLFVCPHCNGSDIAVTSGEELDLTYIEADDMASEGMSG
jgi:hydrogenase nickel incorporation protein HypA/HybF